MRSVTDQDQPVSVADQDRRAHDDIAIGRGQDPGGRSPLDEHAEMTSVRARSLDPGGRTGGDHLGETLSRGRPEQGRLAESGRQDPEGDSRPVVSLRERVAGESIRIRNDRPDGAVRVPDVLARQTAHASEAGPGTVRADDEVERAELLPFRSQPPVPGRRAQAGHLDSGRYRDPGCPDRAVEQIEQRAAMHAPAIGTGNEIVVREVEHTPTMACTGIDATDRRGARLELVSQAERHEDLLAQTLEHDPGADASRLRDSLEHLDIVAISSQEKRRGSPGRSDPDNGDLQWPTQNVLSTTITIWRRETLVNSSAGVESCLRPPYPSGRPDRPREPVAVRGWTSAAWLREGSH